MIVSKTNMLVLVLASIAGGIIGCLCFPSFSGILIGTFSGCVVSWLLSAEPEPEDSGTEDIEVAVWCWRMVESLTEEEGREIQITYPNPDPELDNYYRIDLLIDYGREAGGSTLIALGKTRKDCLRSIDRQLREKDDYEF
jgi:hypothetical protein